MNEAAAECCGSCEYWNGFWRDSFRFCSEHNVYAEANHFNCEGEDYSPRNPIPITDLPVVKELVDVLNELVGIIDSGDKTDSFTTQPANRILKALEAKDE